MLVARVGLDLEQSLPAGHLDVNGTLSDRLESLKDLTLKQLEALATADDWRQRETRLTLDLLNFPDMVLVEKLAEFVDATCDASRLRLEATAAAQDYGRQYVLTCAWSEETDSGLLNTWKSVDDLKNSIRPGVFLGPRHNPFYTIQSHELVRCVASVGVGVVKVLDALEDELPRALLAERLVHC